MWKELNMDISCALLYSIIHMYKPVLEFTRIVVRTRRKAWSACTNLCSPCENICCVARCVSQLVYKQRSCVRWQTLIIIRLKLVFTIYSPTHACRWAYNLLVAVVFVYREFNRPKSMKWIATQIHWESIVFRAESTASSYELSIRLVAA